MTNPYSLPSYQPTFLTYPFTYLPRSPKIYTFRVAGEKLANFTPPDQKAKPPCSSISNDLGTLIVYLPTYLPTYLPKPIHLHCVPACTSTILSDTFTVGHT